MDNELKELCEQVYKVLPDTFGSTDKAFYLLDGEVKLLPMIGIYDKEPEFHSLSYIAPLYNSDMLLEKLPMHIGDYQLRMILPFTTDWRFDYYDGNYNGNGRMRINHIQNTDVMGVSDTPLKALLKLTLALADTNQLNTISENTNE